MARHRAGHEPIARPRFRWAAIALVFLATLIYSIDRMTVSALAPVIRAQAGPSKSEYARLATWFRSAYTYTTALIGFAFLPPTGTAILLTLTSSSRRAGA